MTPAWTPERSAAIVLPEQTQPVPAVAFALHSYELVHHYRGIWRHLDPATFEIVTASEHAPDNERIAAFAAEAGYRSSFVADALEGGRRFAAVVSNHVGSAGTIGRMAEPAIQRLGDLQIRVMYALGKDTWNFASWNDRYDLILCWGPFQAAQLAQYDRPRIVQVGYPRFDRFFAITESRREMVTRLGGDPDRPTLAWLPTWAEHSSIDAFVDLVAALRDTFNVLVKVHPVTARTETERMARIAAAGLTVVDGTQSDNIEVFHAADIIAADYGGSPFGAIYADRDLVLLNTPLPWINPIHEPAGADSLDTRLREWILNVDPDEADAVRAYFADPAAREQQRAVRERLRRSLFAPFDGYASQAAALAIRAALARPGRVVGSEPAGRPVEVR
jgi:hypothetical protein